MTETRSVCPYCGVGCGVVLHVESNRIVKVTGDKTHPSNKGRLCTKGQTCGQPVAAPGRLAHAYLRSERSHEPSRVELDVAIEATARRLRQIIDTHGPDAVAFYLSGQMSLEAQYLANKLAKGFIRTQHVESNSRLCMASAGTGYKQSLGSDAPPGSYDDFDRSDLFFVAGANMADCHPILFLRMMDRVKAGARLIVVDPRRNATADKAHLHLQIRPGTDLALLNGLLHLLVEQGAVDHDFIARHTEGWQDLLDLLPDYPPARVADITGLAEADIRQAAAWIAEAGDWMSCWTMGLNQSTSGTAHTNAICNLHLATGAICRTGSGPFSLTGQPNAMGGREMGYMGPGLPGQRSALVEADRAFVERAWKLPTGTLRAEGGNGTVALFDDMARSRIKAVWVICTNPVATVPNRSKVIAALQTAELVITQDAFLDTETNRYADILLPGALWAEGDGVMINSERNLTLAAKAVDAPGAALPDWQLIARVACAMGYAHAFSYTSAAEVFDEIRQFWNPATGYDLRGASHAALRASPLQWPCAPTQGDAAPQARNPIRYLNDGTGQNAKVDEHGKPVAIAFATPSGKARFWARPWTPAAEQPGRQFPLVLNTGRVQHQWHTMTKTGKVTTLNKLNPAPFVEMHPQDATALGATTGDRIALRSARGAATLPLIATDRVQPGQLFAPMHWNDVAGGDLCINALTHDACDAQSLQPELKFAAVAATLAPQVESLQTVAPPTSASQRQDLFQDTRMNHPTEALHMLELEPADAASPARRPELSNAASASGVSLALNQVGQLLGLPPQNPPAFAEHERLYLHGFLQGLQIRPKTLSPSCPRLPESAPLAPAHRLYVDGLLAGLHGDEPASHPDRPSQQVWQAPSAHPPTPVATARCVVQLAWGSQTGNAETLAQELAAAPLAAGAAPACELDSISLATFDRRRVLVIVTSTFGDGDPPDNAQTFWSQCQALQEPQALAGLRYAVLALGDANYAQFCGFGRALDERLQALGAVRLVDRVDCEADDSEASTGWQARLQAALQTLEATAASNGQDSPAAQAADIDIAPRPVHPDALPRQAPAAATAAASSAAPISRRNPASARLLSSRLLNGPGSSKETRQIVLDLRGTGLRYRAGDALGVWPANSRAAVDEFLAATGLPDADDALRQSLTYDYDLSRPSLDLLRWVQQCSGSAVLADRLRGSPANAPAPELAAWLHGRHIADVAREFPLQASANAWLAVLKRLQPRLYSIASSPLVTPDEVHLTVSTVRYPGVEAPAGAPLRGGTCSTYLADHDGSAPVRVFVQPSAHFHVPANGDTPVIMIGPGTGIAPFRGFMQERRATGALGKNWLFFGEQKAASDFYYRNEWQQLSTDGCLHRLDTAFSRDQVEKIYVQDRLRENGRELWQWLQNGASLYVCGDASRMARDVDAALAEIAERHGGLDAEGARAFLGDLARAKRYVRDVY